MAEKDKEFDVDEALERLEEINSKLASGEQALAESIDLYKEGVTLATKCKEHLEGVEQELQIINQNEGD